MNAWLIIACVFGAVLTLAAIVFGWLAWETRGGPAPYDPEDDESPVEEIKADRLADDAFKDFRQSIAEILDRDPARRDELMRDLQAATAAWELRKFKAATKPLRRDREFRRSIRAAERAANDTQT